jgi:rsbT co-antagonist protein RsbR
VTPEAAETPRGEFFMLRQQIATLEQSLSEAQQQAAAAQTSAERFYLLCQASMEGIVIQDRGRITDANQMMATMFGYDHTEIIGREVLSLLTPESQTIAATYLRSHADAPFEIVGLRKDGSTFPIEVAVQTIHGHETTQRVAVIRDISERKRAEAERIQLQEAIIQAQAVALAELSTPLIPITDQVMVMPLIGTLDSRRMQQVFDTLLQGMASSQAQVAILDITGVSVVDTQVANVLVRVAQAVQLLGAQVVLTGIRPEVAQTLVGLGIDLGSMVTRSSLQSGITYAISHR